jgi:hypothetical protein
MLSKPVAIAAITTMTARTSTRMIVRMALLFLSPTGPSAQNPNAVQTLTTFKLWALFRLHNAT